MGYVLTQPIRVGLKQWLILGYLRIVDESGEDYGYSASRFFAIDVPKTLEKALLKAAS